MFLFKVYSKFFAVRETHAVRNVSQSPQEAGLTKGSPRSTPLGRPFFSACLPWRVKNGNQIFTN
jgi:hypothetical protein